MATVNGVEISEEMIVFLATLTPIPLPEEGGDLGLDLDTLDHVLSMDTDWAVLAEEEIMETNGAGYGLSIEVG